MKLYFSLISGLLVVMTLSLFVGYSEIAPLQILKGLFGAGDPATVLVVQEIRLPRALLAALVGAALGLGGAGLQGLLRNPLAEPGIIGITSGAALGAVVMLYFGLASLSTWALPTGAMMGAALVTVLIFLLAGSEGRITAVILAGVAVGTFATSLTALAMNLSPNPWALAEIIFWLMGSVRDRSMTDVWLALPFIVAGTTLMLSAGRGLNALLLGEDAAQSLGVSLVSVRLRIILGTAMAVGAAVAVAGAIGFIGLVVPHLLRPFTGYEPGRLLLPSAIGGAALLTLADIGVRLLEGMTGTELYLGVLTALIGGPFFVWLIVRMRTGAV